MKNPLKRDVPPRAAAVVVALALLAGVVTGREQVNAPPVLEPAGKRVTEAKEELDFDPGKLVRQRREGEIQDLFASRIVAPPVAAAPSVQAANPQPPPAPSVPPLPFKYLGRMTDGGKVTVFLERNQDTLSAAEGETLDNTYRIESIAEFAVHFVYLPLGMKQVLNVPAK